MAEETLVKEVLTSEMIDGGRELTIQLDKTELDVTASFWFYFIDSMRWNLIFGISQILTEGPIRPISIIQDVLNQQPIIRGVNLLDVIALQSDHSMIRRLKNLVTTGKAIRETRISQAVVENVFIQDAYIYRLMWSSSYRR
jgi:hypothetical protein